jgi:hypothetical protein
LSRRICYATEKRKKRPLPTTKGYAQRIQALKKMLRHRVTTLAQFVVTSFHKNECNVTEVELTISDRNG